ncbi:MAG TPA: hypothetical protein VMW36_03155, partial [Patescibacteria group bacterium]|nr:hypothetical protein [Patescibacteria group bacterium]
IIGHNTYAVFPDGRVASWKESTSRGYTVGPCVKRTLIWRKGLPKGVELIEGVVKGVDVEEIIL